MSISIDKIGEQVKKFRELRNYTQESMAQKLQMSTQGYGKIERNEVEITLQKLQKIAHTLDTTIQDILGFEDKFVFNNQEAQYYTGVNNSPNANVNEIKEIYESRIKDLKEENQRLHGLLEKSLTK